MPASPGTTDGILNEPVVAPAILEPFFVHWNVNGPVPDGVVLKLALVPGQRTSEVNAVADVAVFTVRVAQLVTLPQEPVTMTQ